MMTSVEGALIYAVLRHHVTVFNNQFSRRGWMTLEDHTLTYWLVPRYHEFGKRYARGLIATHQTWKLHVPISQPRQ